MIETTRRFGSGLAGCVLLMSLVACNQILPDASDYGYWGLFVFSFVASTLIAAPADVMAMAMPQLGFHPVGVALVGTLGGYLGNVVNYFVGRYGASFFLTRYVQQDDEQEGHWFQRAESLYDRYGVWTLLLSGAPFIGDPLTTVAGAFKVRWWVFTALVVVGKLLKFVLLLGATDLVMGFYR